MAPAGHAAHPADNEPNALRVELGKKLFFDPRLSGDGNMSCASVPQPAVRLVRRPAHRASGAKSMVLGRASPTVVNTAFNGIQMWDGRKKSLEDQAMGPMEANSRNEHATPTKLFNFLNGERRLQVPCLARPTRRSRSSADTLAKAIASFERTVISNNAPFDRWVAGNAKTQ